MLSTVAFGYVNREHVQNFHGDEYKPTKSNQKAFWRSLASLSPQSRVEKGHNLMLQACQARVTKVQAAAAYQRDEIYGLMNVFRGTIFHPLVTVRIIKFVFSDFEWWRSSAAFVLTIQYSFLSVRSKILSISAGNATDLPVRGIAQEAPASHSSTQGYWRQ